MNDLIVRVLKINIYVFWPVFEGYYVIMQDKTVLKLNLKR